MALPKRWCDCRRAAVLSAVVVSVRLALLPQAPTGELSVFVSSGFWRSRRQHNQPRDGVSQRHFFAPCENLDLRESQRNPSKKQENGRSLEHGLQDTKGRVKRPGDVVEVRCEDDGCWYQAEVYEDARGKLMVQFDKDGYEYYYPLVAWRTLKSGDTGQSGDTGLSAFESVDPAQWLAGVVQEVHSWGAFVAVQPPGGGEERKGLVHVSRIDPKGGFVDTAVEVLEPGQEVSVRVIGVDSSLGRLDLSMRRMMTGFEALADDVWLDGVVTGVKAFGALVQVHPPSGSSDDAVIGTVHLAELGKKDMFVDNAEDVVKVGDTVSVRVLRIKDGQLDLSMRPASATALPALQALPENVMLTGVVSQIAEKLGAFVEVQPPQGGETVKGLLHISEIAEDGGFVTDIKDFLTVGQAVSVRVKSVEPETGKLSLSRRRVPEELAALQALPANATLTGVVSKIIENTYAFVLVQPPEGGEAVEGLLHISEISDNFVKNIEDFLTVGQAVSVGIRRVESGKLYLTRQGRDGYRALDSSK